MKNNKRSSIDLERCIFNINGTLCLATLLAAFLLTSSIPVSADDPVIGDDPPPISCTLSGTVDIPHSIRMQAGTYETDIGATTLKSLCNDQGGYSIYAVGYSGDKHGNTEMVSEIDGVQNITTGIATSGSKSNWSMKISPVSGTFTPTIDNDFDNYNLIPSTQTKIAHFGQSTDSEIGSSIRSTYAIYISETQEHTTYTGKVKYTLMHPNDSGAPPEPQVTTSGRIRYYANAIGIAPSTGDQIIYGSNTTSMVLYPPNYKRPGYGFAGWSDQFDYDIESNNNTGNIYGPNETITFEPGQYSGGNPGLSLYAIWVPSKGVLQNRTCPDNTAMPIGTVTALTDTRDNDTYAVAKLQDEKCWMIENLRLDAGDSFDATQSSTGVYGGVFSGLANPEISGFSSSGGSNSRYTIDGSGSLYNPLTNPPTLTDIGVNDNPSQRMTRYDNSNTKTIVGMNSPAAPVYSYGNYYTWHSVIADTTAYTQGNMSAENSICPKGWRVPIGGNKYNEANNEIWELVVNKLNEGVKPANYNSEWEPGYRNAEAVQVDKKISAYPNNFVYSGYIEGNLYFRGNSARYWTSTAYNIVDAYFTYSNDSAVKPGTGYAKKTTGLTVRCITGQ